MWQAFVRAGLALWFIGMIGLGVWQQQAPDTVQAAGGTRVYLPLAQKNNAGYDPTFRDYVGLVATTRSNGLSDYYTVRGDGTEWRLLAENVYEAQRAAWSPDGAHFLYNIGNTRNVQLASFATQESRTVMRGTATYVKWSPDSRRVAFLNQGQWVVYNVQSAQIELQTDIGTTPDYSNFKWSPNSEYLTWGTYYLNGRTGPIWVWGGVGRQAYRLDGAPPTESTTNNTQWSPDSRRFLFNGAGTSGIYTVDANASVATLLRNDGYELLGWVRNGGGLLLAKEDGLYLAEPTATATPVLLEQLAYLYTYSVRINPRGDGFYYNRDNQSYFYNLNTNTATPVSARCVQYILGLRWLNDGQILCYARLPRSYTYGYYESSIVAISPTPTTLRVLTDYVPVPLLAPTSNVLAFDHLPLANTYYPGPAYEGSYLYEVDSDKMRRIAYPQSRRQSVLEWRYMP